MCAARRSKRVASVVELWRYSSMFDAGKLRSVRSLETAGRS